MSERDLERLVDDAPDVIARFDRERRYLYVNRAIEAATGRPPAAFMGRTGRELDLPRDFCDVWEEAIDRVFAAGEPVEIEYVLPDVTRFPRTYHARLVRQEGCVAAYVRDVTATRPPAGMYEQLFQETGDAVLVCDDQRRYVDANPAAAKLFGVPTTELLGTRIEDYADGEFDVEDAWKAFLATGQMEGEFPVKRRGGGVRIVDYRARAHFRPGRHLSILRDITERKDAERLFDLERRRFAEIMGQLPSGVIIAEAPSGRLVYANARAKKIWGRELPVTNPVPDDGLWTVRGRAIRPEELPMARALRGETVLRETLLHEVDGRSRILVTNSVPIRDAAGSIVGAVSVFDDETDESRANEERAKLLQTLELFIAILGHDLRNPLAAIGLAAYSLENGNEVSERGKTVVARVASAVQRATRLVDQLLDVTRIRSGAGLPMAPAPADLEHIARRAVEELGAKEVRLEASGDTGGTFDEDRLAQLVGNLLANATAHGAPGGAIDLAVRGDTTGVELAITNRGTPIPEAVQTTLFEPFRKQEGSVGLGLGLFICSEIARAHGGTLTVSSTERDGTSFKLRIPR